MTKNKQTNVVGNGAERLAELPVNAGVTAEVLGRKVLLATGFVLGTLELDGTAKDDVLWNSGFGVNEGTRIVLEAWSIETAVGALLIKLGFWLGGTRSGIVSTIVPAASRLSIRISKTISVSLRVLGKMNVGFVLCRLAGAC
jgi:hypothetical protein